MYVAYVKTKSLDRQVAISKVEISWDDSLFGGLRICPITD